MNIDRWAERARVWLEDAFFPMWSANGLDPRGGFVERLNLHGIPILNEPSRVRVQARQTYVFSLAVDMRWRDGAAREHVIRGVDFLLNSCRRSDKLFGKVVLAGQGLTDPQPDLYDNAFCLLALSAAANALCASELLDEAALTLAALDATLAHPAGGFRESAPDRAPRRQNPHMHLFEALLSLHSADPERDFFCRAEGIFDLLKEKFVDPESDFLLENFEDDWRPLRGPQGDIVEPGHMFEWSWLLAQFGRWRPEASALAKHLYAAALPFLDARGFSPQTADRNGRVIDGRRRAWPQTEAVKAHLAAFEAGDFGAMERVDRGLSGLFDDYLSGVPDGAWRDHIDAQGRMLATDVPASTGYHIALALAELMRVSKSRQPDARSAL